MSTIKCAVCGADTDLPLCVSCTNKLERTLAELPAAMRDLEVTVTRQARVGNTPHPHAVDVSLLEVEAGEERRIPARLRTGAGRITLPASALLFQPSAAQLRDEVRTMLARHVAHVAADHGLRPPVNPRGTARLTVWRNRPLWTSTPPRPVTAQDRCTWLVAHIDTIRGDARAADLHRDATRAARRIHYAVDRRDPDVFAGRCIVDVTTVTEPIPGTLVPSVEQCGTDLYARVGETEAVCTACRSVYDLAAQKKYLIAAAHDVIADVSTIANGLTSLLEKVTPDMIRQMAHRREIFARGSRATAKGGRAQLYRVGDVVEVLLRRAERKAAASAGKHAARNHR